MRNWIALFVLLALAACKDGSGPAPTATLSLSLDSVSVAAGGTTVVNATITNSTATAQFVSRDSAIARVSATGLITGRVPGRTVVVGILNGNANVRDSLIVVVTPIVNPGAVLQLNPDSVGTTVGAATQIHAVVTPIQAVLFVSRNQAIAVVDGNGLVTGTGVGKTVIVGSLAAEHRQLNRRRQRDRAGAHHVGSGGR
jgi:hypothetical protein